MRASVNQIILAQESDFNLGGLMISPSRRQVIAGRGISRPVRELLQPRIMQVLVALARRRGEVVSRDEMMAVCWGGFAVSDDAINRCIARLRRLSETHGGFTLETIARVGYQLNEDRAPESKPVPETAAPVLSEASITALLAPAPAAEAAAPVPVAVSPPPSPALVSRPPSWAERHGIVAAMAFAAGVALTAAVFAGAHLP